MGYRFLVLSLIIFGSLRVFQGKYTPDILKSFNKLTLTPNGRVFLSDHRFKKLKIEYTFTNGEVEQMNIEPGFEVQNLGGFFARHQFMYFLTTYGQFGYAKMVQSGQIQNLCQRHSKKELKTKQLKIIREEGDQEQPYEFRYDCP